jgi:hypothetical protein
MTHTSKLAWTLGVLALLVPTACDESKDSGGDPEIANIGETEAPADDDAEDGAEGNAEGGTDVGTEGGVATDDGAGACVDDTDCPAGEACRDGVCSGGAGDAGETGVAEDDGGACDPVIDPACAGQACVEDADCPVGESCREGFCGPGGGTDGGGTDSGGTDGGGTDGGACDPKLDPECVAECLADEDCALGQVCVDNRCLG